ncbi:MAG TPA: hypothetical protein VFV81_03915, partial [Verrucomicrobiae bacterium]|nr:hypothetical protein [Verrucomicrobiae bacterium]
MKSGFWRKLRVTFRWCRITVWLAALALICAFIWVNRIGLPHFVTQQFVDALRRRGVDLQFTRMRLHLFSGIVAENVRIGDVRMTNNPTLSFAQVRLPINFTALLHRKVEIDGVALRQGKLVLPLSPTNAMVVDNIQTDVRFQPEQTWSLDRFSARCDGIHFNLSGEIAHAPELGKLFRGRKPSGRSTLQERLKKFTDTLEKIHFEGQPQIRLDVKGDALEAGSFVARLNVTAPGAETPWGSGHDIELAARLSAPGASTNALGAWEWWTNAQPALQLIAVLRVTNAVALEVPVDWLQTHVSCSNFLWQLPDLEIRQGPTRMQIRADENELTREFHMGVNGNIDPESLRPLLAQTNRTSILDRVSFTAPIDVQATVEGRANDYGSLRARGAVAVTNFAVQIPQIPGAAMPLDLVAAQFSLSNRLWRLTDATVAQGDTRLALDGQVEAGTGEFQAGVRGDFAPETLRPVLTHPAALREINHLSFSQPVALDVRAHGSLRDFNGVGAEGTLAATNFAIWDQSVESIASRFSYTNRIVTFWQPVMFREHGSQKMTADTITMNFPEQRLLFTNGFSTADPVAFIHTIGPKTARIISPFIDFQSPPTVRVEGRVPLHDINHGEDMDDADLSFWVLQPAPYHVKKFSTDGVQGTARWLGQFLLLSNVSAEFYGGHGTGFATFDFHPKEHVADYHFGIDVVDVDIHRFAAALERTNKLEGYLTGQLVVTNGNTESLMTWNGYGHASLRDGLIWDEPVFGFLSPVLNTIYPGLGNSRATGATATFGLTNGVFQTDSLEIRSTLVRLNYSGTVDLEENLNANVTGQLLRDVPAVGPLVSTVLWPMSKLFEYHITGTLKHPKSDPVYVPKFLLLPLHPIKTIEGILPGGDFFSTNA